MTNSFNDPVATNLVGLWDFSNGDETKDTGLADGIAQDGHLNGDASISGGQLHTDGSHDYFDVQASGATDAPFNLSEGTVAVQFTQDDHVGGSPDVVVNRGEYDDRHDEGWFGLSVTHDGKVTVDHADNGQSAHLSTDAHFFNEHDTIKATYSWSETDGLTLRVQNLTQQTETTITSAQTGLSMDVTDTDDESWTFGAREEDDGDYDQFFKGSIDYVAVYDKDMINNGPDGAVDGEATGEVMELGYDDANAPTDNGGDVITDDADLIFGNGGDDTIDGAGGNDTIYGDSGPADTGPVEMVRESFEWDKIADTNGGAGAVDNGDPLEGGVTQNTGNVDVSFSVVNATSHVRTEFADNQQKVHSITDDGDGVDAHSSMASELDGNHANATYAFDFSKEVENVSFRINDIDGDGVVKVYAYDADGHPVDLDIHAGSHLHASDQDGVAGTEVLDSNGGYEQDTSPNYSGLFNIAGPVARIEVQHLENGPNNSGINITDMYYDAPVGPVDNGVAGDDSIFGGEGDDVIYGEAGSDTLLGDDGHDTIFGGAGDDSAEGGAGDDLVDDEFGASDGQGNDTFSGGAGNDTLWGGDDDDLLFGDDGDDFLGGEVGNDTLTGGDGADTVMGYEDADDIIGGTAGDVVDGGSEGDDNDTLDLSDEGPLRVVDETDDADGNSTSGTVEFLNSDGTVSGSMTFAEIENLILPDNLDPNAVNDAASTDEDGSVTIPVLANDSDPETAELSVTDASDGANGTTAVNADGTITYTPDADFNGTDSFTYTISDGNGGTDTATVNVTVGAVNDGPVAADDSGPGDEDVAITGNVLGNDSDVDGNPLEVVDNTDPANGTLVINPDGSYTYTPDPDFNGTDSFSYTVSDGQGGTDTATVALTVGAVNDNPVASADTATTAFEEDVTVPVLDNDGDVDGDTLRVTTTTDPDNGSVVVNGDGTITYTPDAGFSGDDTFSYTVTDDQGGFDTATVTVTVGENPRDGIVEGTADGELIDVNYQGDPDGDEIDAGDAVLTGEAPNDDIVQAGGGDDTVIAGLGDDDVDAGDGNDSVLGQDGNDSLQGMAGQDTLDGGVGDDTLDGGADNDVLTGGDGNDSALGGDGDDNIDTSASTPVNDYETFVGIPFETGADQLNDLDTVDGGDGNDTISTGDDADLIFGGAGDDVIDGGIDADTIEGGAGNDFIDGNLGSDSILGGDGNDTIEAGIDAFSDYVGDDPNLPNGLAIDPATGLPATSDPNPDDGRDFVDGGAGDDVINTGDDADTIIGGTGQDTINAGIDDDSVQGNAGDDSITGSHGSDTIFGGDGNDTIWAGFGNDPVAGIAGEVPDATDPVPENGLDYVDGGAGDDLIYGEDDDDTLLGGTGEDTIDGGVDDDQIEGGEGDDSLIGGQGDDTLDGGDGDDVIDALEGADFVEGGAGQDTITAGGDGDVLRGGDDADTFLIQPSGAGDSTITVYGDAGGDDNDTLDLTGLSDSGYEVSGITRTPENNGNPGFDGQVQLFNSGTGETATVNYFDIENVIPCFTPGTVIATPKGERQVEDLQIGDRIITRDNGIQEIRWLGRRDLQGRELLQAPHLKPVLIRAGSLGHGLPESDMIVSPNHRMLINNDRTALYFEEREVLASAKHLTGLDGVDTVEASSVSYIHFMFDQHEVVLSNGAWTESFQPGEQTMDGMGQSQRDEIYDLFPELRDAGGLGAYQAARRSLKKHEAKLLVK